MARAETQSVICTQTKSIATQTTAPLGYLGGCLKFGKVRGTPMQREPHSFSFSKATPRASDGTQSAVVPAALATITPHLQF